MNVRNVLMMMNVQCIIVEADILYKLSQIAQKSSFLCIIEPKTVIPVYLDHIKTKVR